MNRIGFLTFLLSAVTLFPQLAQAQGQSNRAWQNDVFLYGLASSISGDAQLGGPVQLPVDVSFSDILDNLQMGFMGGYRGSSERFSVVADVICLGLGNSSDTGLVRRADLDQLIVDVTGGYRAFGQDFKDAGGSERFSLDVTYYGPLFGLGFHF